MCACFTSKLQSLSAGQEEEDQAVFICVCECHVGAANDTEGLCVHWHLWSTHTAYYRLDLQTGGAPVASIGVGRDEPPGSECSSRGWGGGVPWDGNPPVPRSVTSDTSYSKQKKVLPKSQILLSRAASFPRNL